MLRKVLKIIGMIVKKRRLDQGITLQNLAQTADNSVGYLHKIEHGTANFSMKKLFDIIKALNFSVDGFFSEVITQYLVETQKEHERIIQHAEKKKKRTELFEIVHDPEAIELIKELLAPDNHLQYIQDHIENVPKLIGDDTGSQKENATQPYHPEPETN